ncbi:auxin-responsive protein SAUR36-like [Aegilops tauschii subsp. strangulata]|uniref:Auxin-responsive protein SAUR36 n=1 Tax=Aegilops tauschii subsp. strangulata TaxID=200361 RepID=A0A453LJD7_AEGTS|nr:auxin-responsive protein SAUR36-like [Aegilops tauschii subsp. strangulata]
MIHSKKLAQLAKKWQRMVAVGGQQTAAADGCCSTTSVADRGHCVMYTADGSRFEVPLVYLGTMVFRELLRMSQEEFGFSSDGKITLPFDASVMEYVMCLIRRDASEEVEKAFLSSIARPCHSASCVASVRLNQQFAVCS